MVNLKNSFGPVAEHGIINKEPSTPLTSLLKCNGMLQWGIQRKFAYLNKHGDDSTSSPQSLANFVKESEQILIYKSEEDEDKNHEEEDNTDEEEEEEEEESDNDITKRYSLRENTRKAKKVKLENRKQSRKNTKNKCKKLALGNSFNRIRWSSSRYKLAERNLLEVMKAKGAVVYNPILRPDLRMEAKKKIGDTGLLDHLLKHVPGKLTPGGA